MSSLQIRLLVLALLFGGLAALASSPVSAQGSSQVEVVDTRGIIDGPIETAIRTALEVAEREASEAVILQIDSAGTIDAERARRLARLIAESAVPVITWVGPAGAQATHGAAVLTMAAHVSAMAPGAALGPVSTLDLRARDTTERVTDAAELGRDLGVARDIRREAILALFIEEPHSADSAEDAGLVDVVAVQLPDLLDRVDGREVVVAGEPWTLRTGRDEVTMRLRKADLWGRMVHAATQPSLIYLFLLTGLVGLVFELFHPSTGPAGLAGLVGIGLGLYGVYALNGSWLGVALIVLGVAGFCVDLRFQGLGIFTVAGLAGLIAGSILLFRGPWLHVNPWVLVFGICGMVVFLLGAMTRVLRDLRAIARGELEVRDPHPHPD